MFIFKFCCRCSFAPSLVVVVVVAVVKECACYCGIYLRHISASALTAAAAVLRTSLARLQLTRFPSHFSRVRDFLTFCKTIKVLMEFP